MVLTDPKYTIKFGKIGICPYFTNYASNAHILKLFSEIPLSKWHLPLKGKTTNQEKTIFQIPWLYFRQIKWKIYSISAQKRKPQIKRKPYFRYYGSISAKSSEKYILFPPKRENHKSRENVFLFVCNCCQPTMTEKLKQS